MQFVSDWYKTQEMCNKAVDIFPFVFDSVPDWYKTQEMCHKVVSKEPFTLKNCLDRYKTKEMLDKAVVAFLQTMIFFVIGLLRIKYWNKFKMLYFLMVV